MSKSKAVKTKKKGAQKTKRRQTNEKPVSSRYTTTISALRKLARKKEGSKAEKLRQLAQEARERDNKRGSKDQNKTSSIFQQEFEPTYILNSSICLTRPDGKVMGALAENGETAKGVYVLPETDKGLGIYRVRHTDKKDTTSTCIGKFTVEHIGLGCQTKPIGTEPTEIKLEAKDGKVDALLTLAILPDTLRNPILTDQGKMNLKLTMPQKIRKES